MIERNGGPKRHELSIVEMGEWWLHFQQVPPAETAQALAMTMNPFLDAEAREVVHKLFPWALGEGRVAKKSETSEDYLKKMFHA